MTKNEEFYNKIISFESEGKLKISVPQQNLPEKFFRVKIGDLNRYISLHIDIVDFAKEIEDMIETGNFFTQRMLEQELGCSNTKIMNMVQNGQYEMITRGFKLYIKKDW